MCFTGVTVEVLDEDFFYLQRNRTESVQTCSNLDSFGFIHCICTSVYFLLKHILLLLVFLPVLCTLNETLSSHADFKLPFACVVVITPTVPFIM